MLFNLTLSTAQFPDEWKEATVTPVFKKRGAACLPTNYQTISLLSVTAKVFEAVVYEQLYEHVDWLLADSFRHNDGPALQLVRIVHNLKKRSILDRPRLRASMIFLRLLVEMA